jgi:amino acid adenylation domain-containing protein
MISLRRPGLVHSNHERDVGWAADVTGANTGEPQGKAVPLPELCIHELFEAQVTRAPNATAVVMGEERISYATLNARANRLAHHLLALGVAPEERIAVCAERSIDLVVAMLAILKTGGAYMPLDPDSPSDRLRFMLRDGGARIFLTSPGGAASRVEGPHHVAFERAENFSVYPVTNPGIRGRRDGSAYVCFTSGSTGIPKGVDVLHVGVVRLLMGVTYVRLDATRVVLHAAPAAFDATTFEVWGPLLHGACAALLPERVLTPDTLRATIARHGVTTAFLTTALVNAIVDEDPLALGGLEQLLFGGEAVSVGHVYRLQRACPDLELVHCYGPTETTTFATTYPIANLVDPRQTTIPIGRPIEHTSAHVLAPDQDMQVVAVGEVGELFLGGLGVARGYVGRPELTRERFVPDVFSDVPGARLYRTGDMVRLLPTGDLEFVGRRDNQVKIRGHRIELGEIESHLMSQPAIREAVVLCREVKPGDPRLVAYLIPHASLDLDLGLDLADMRARLRAELPEYMVPQHAVILDRFPLTANGKVNRAALPQPDLDAQPRTRPYVAPTRDVEQWLARLWGELLGLTSIGSEDDFFELGGNSLMAIRSLARIRERYEVEVSVSSFFVQPTIAALARGIDATLYLRQGEPKFHLEGAREDWWI